MLRRYAFQLSYLGTMYHGWQIQTNANSIQSHVEKALEIILRQKKKITGASRTDAGVHAKAQVFCFDSEESLDPQSLIKSLNALLPRDMSVIAGCEVNENFHPIMDCKSKTYIYTIWPYSSRNPLFSQIQWHYRIKDLDIPKLQSIWSQFIGIHDFTSFCATDSGAKTKTRHILDVKLTKHSELGLEFLVKGNGFLKQMVRTMVGTSLDIYEGKKSSIIEILNQKDRRCAGTCAPAQGLCLYEIEYKQTLF